MSDCKHDYVAEDGCCLECGKDILQDRIARLEGAYGIAQDYIAHLEKRIAKAIEIAGSMKSLDAHRRLMEVLEGD